MRERKRQERNSEEFGYRTVETNCVVAVTMIYVNSSSHFCLVQL